MITPTRPCAVPPGHSLFSVTVTTTRTVKETFLVAAADLDGLCPPGVAAWDANELPLKHRHRAPDLWDLVSDL